MKFFQPQPFLDVQNKQMISAPMGSMLFERMKSSRPWMSPIPGIWKPAHTLKPSAHGSDSTMSRTPLMATDLVRDQPHWSMANAIMPSNTAMMVERAAKLMNTKNSEHHNWPSGICSKTLGNVTKTKPGPEPGSTPKAKHAGKMMRPAMRATNVSRAPTRIDSPMSERSLPM